MVPLKYPSNFWETIEILLIKCKINVFQTGLAKKKVLQWLVLLRIKTQKLSNCNLINSRDCKTITTIKINV